MNALVIGRCPKTAEQLNSICDNVFIVLDGSFQNQRAIPELDNFTILYSAVNIRHIKGIPSRTREIISWIRENQIDVVFSSTKWDMVAAKIASFFVRRKVVLLATSHNSYSWQNPINVFFLSFIIRLSTDCYIALAQFVYDKLLSVGFNESRLLHLPNTISADAWNCKKEYSFQTPFKIAYVAVLYPGKRQDFLVDIISHIADVDIVVDCYGDLIRPEYVDLIMEKARSYGIEDKIRLLGRVENANLRVQLNNYDAYICPSQLEMSPVNILEAMSAGLPVIATNTGGIPDIIEDGKNGLLFEVDNIEQAVSCLERIIHDSSLREQIALAGRRYVSNEYTPRAAGQRIKEKIERSL